MNRYEQKQADRRERLEARAAALAGQAQQTYGTARRMAEAIPFGQPILVGHHSGRLLKGAAFKWSPTRNAWVRQMTNAARWAGRDLRSKLDALASR
ncbi:hypothetical protein XthCFBP4691_07610 [Xanthomonas theicola]|uniref:DUF3560 domain-containing protein n=1 Tax=Xanthomonas theicola TaxID=56464 RepID=A0A2S6ZH03_9XANT|nr:hypothetical protein XthCFBP4691_07610 [Xanthomonas theicola]QNH27235.1 DUF3560 domain-containing protein [Xanthomonas theicola]